MRKDDEEVDRELSRQGRKGMRRMRGKGEGDDEFRDIKGVMIRWTTGGDVGGWGGTGRKTFTLHEFLLASADPDSILTILA